MPLNREKAKARNRRWYVANREKAKAKLQQWRVANREKSRAFARHASTRGTTSLSDRYIKELLRRKGTKEPSPEFIQLYRKWLILLRQSKQPKKEK